MSPTVTAGLDGSAESRAAADWAAREALRREATLALVHVHETAPYPFSTVLDSQAERNWSERTTRALAAGLVRRFPALRVTAEHLLGRPSRVLAEVSAGSEVLVLGTRGLGTVLGFVVGSVALPTVAHAACPVVVVRIDARLEDDSTDTPGDVVLGLKLDRPGDELLSFAFDAAARRSAVLRVVHGWEPPPVYGPRPIAVPSGVSAELNGVKTDLLSDLLLPWREKYPQVEVDCRAVIGQPGRRLVEAAADVSLVVVGRRTRRSALGTHIGSVAQTVLHHADVPVAVVPHN